MVLTQLEDNRQLRVQGPSEPRTDKAPVRGPMLDRKRTSHGSKDHPETEPSHGIALFYFMIRPLPWQVQLGSQERARVGRGWAMGRVGTDRAGAEWKKRLEHSQRIQLDSAFPVLHQLSLRDVYMVFF